MRLQLGVLVVASVVLLGLSMAQQRPVASQDKDKPGPTLEEEGLPIDVTSRGKRVLIPIAVPQVKGSSRVAQELTEVIRFDLQISGYFNVLPENSFFFDTDADGMTPSTINFQNWFNVGAQGLVKGVAKGGKDGATIDLRLFEVDKARQVRLKWKKGSAGKREIRKMAHEFVNALLEYYTGTRGIFGTPIAFAARAKGGQKHVYVMDMDGANVFRLSKNDSINILPTWGSGGVYYTSYIDDNPNLYLWSGGSSRLVSDKPGQNSGAAECGGKLAVTLSMGGNNVDLYLISPGGGIIKRLTSHYGIDTSPTFSPDCGEIAFVSDRAGGPQIFKMSAGGGGATQLTHAGKYNTTPDWSPKGDRIAFTGQDGRRSDIFTVTPDGYIERLTQDQGHNEEPSYSPDGNYIVFVSRRGGAGSRLYIMTADGEVQTLITKNGSGYSTPSWGR